MAQDPFKYFRPEATDLVDQFARNMLELEKGNAATDAVRKLLRLAHTLKGAARVVKQTGIADLAHAIEDTLSPHRDTGDGVSRDDIDAVLKHLDEISSKVASLGKEMAATAEAGAKAEPDKAIRTIRADIAETDAVLEGVAETHALLNGLRNAAQGMEQMRRLSDLLAGRFVASGPAERRPSSGMAGQRGAVAEELRRKFGTVGREFGQTIDQMDRELRQLREAAERLRLVAAGSLFTALERTARDVARTQGKQVAFGTAGGDVRLDAHVLETVQGALIQIVRNAVAHGIETENERIDAGKPPAGTVSIKVERRGRQIVFTCCDDGRGVDLDAVRRVAAQRGMIGTSGATFKLIIPPSLASMEALVVEAGGQGNAASIPLDAVRGTMRLTAKDIAHGSSGATVLYDGVAIPFMPLPTALAGASWPAGRNWTAIVVAGAMGLAALGVDRLLGTGPTVVRTLPDGTTASAVVAGASLDTEGNPQLVIDPDGLVAAAYRGTAGALKSEATKRPLLVVDDSMTTRMLEKSILESTGYDVDVALSGEEALDCLRAKHFALILVDVEMPGMDGFTFVERLRADPVRHDIPAILVTSRASPDDLKRGRDVGANGHIVKSEFDQAELLATIERLAG